MRLHQSLGAADPHTTWGWGWGWGTYLMFSAELLPLAPTTTCPACPCPPLQELVAACLQDDHTQRPTFDSIVDTLAGLLKAAERRANRA